LRYFNAAGGDPDEEIKQPKRKENNLIPIALRSLQQECGSISVFGSDYDTEDGTCVRDYIHVNDLGSAHITAVEQLLSGAASSFYNLGNGNGYSVKEVLSTVEEVTGLKLDITQGARRQGDPPFLIADANKAKKALQWKPSYPDLYSMVSHAWKAMQ
jgi:UDP-glucose 4-epimerase